VVQGIWDDGDDLSFITHFGSYADGMTVKWDTDLSWSGSTDMYMTFTASYRSYLQIYGINDDGDFDNIYS
jgi:hypothetical protein